MTGRRTRRWLDRLRAVVGRGPSNPERTGLDGFSARSRPQTVRNPPPNATPSAPAAREGADSAPVSRDAPSPAEAPVAPVTGEPHEADGTAAASEPAVTDELTGPRVRVHRDRLERRVAPMDLSPTEALRLAQEGRAGLSRRELPPDVAGDDPGGSDGTDAD